MDNKKKIDIIKTAILLEKRGKAFYSTCASHALDADVKQLFNLLAEEEDEHIRVLSAQFKNIQKENKFSFKNNSVASDDVANEVLSKKARKAISAAGFEAAAIASAIDMETRAIEAYSSRAKEATDEEEKKFYNWLADWERGHHKMLLEIDNELKEKIWNDNHFWPF